MEELIIAFTNLFSNPHIITALIMVLLNYGFYLFLQEAKNNDKK